MTEAAVPDEKRMRLRYAGTCRVYAVELLKGVDAIYEKSSKTVRCAGCPERGPTAESDANMLGVELPTGAHSGIPGASARREFERRAARREERIRAKHKRLGGLMLAVSDDPQSTRAWGAGATGGERLGARLNEFTGDLLRVLHDRKIPGARPTSTTSQWLRTGSSWSTPSSTRAGPRWWSRVVSCARE